MLVHGACCLFGTYNSFSVMCVSACEKVCVYVFMNAAGLEMHAKTCFPLKLVCEIACIIHVDICSRMWWDRQHLSRSGVNYVSPINQQIGIRLRAGGKKIGTLVQLVS